MRHHSCTLDPVFDGRSDKRLVHRMPLGRPGKGTAGAIALLLLFGGFTGFAWLEGRCVPWHSFIIMAALIRFPGRFCYRFGPWFECHGCSPYQVENQFCRPELKRQLLAETSHSRGAKASGSNAPFRPTLATAQKRPFRGCCTGALARPALTGQTMFDGTSDPVVGQKRATKGAIERFRSNQGILGSCGGAARSFRRSD